MSRKHHTEEITIGSKISKDLHNKMIIICQSKSMSMSELIRNMLNAQVKKEFIKTEDWLQSQLGIIQNEINKDCERKNNG